MKRFSVKFIPPSSLKPYNQNTKIHTRKNVRGISALLERYNFDQPIVVDKDMVIIKGHGRYIAAIQASRAIVPIIIRDDLTVAQCKAARIADNKVFEMGVVDDQLVSSELHDFISEGGEGAGVVFDFAPVVIPGDTSPSSPVETLKETTQPDEGSMFVCPKCDSTFWEGIQ